jgi:hypothetical protein
MMGKDPGIKGFCYFIVRNKQGNPGSDSLVCFLPLKKLLA